MDVPAALSRQYKAGLVMLADVIDKCPDELWVSGTHPRTFWRIAYHACFYTHLYLQPEEAAFQPWDKHRDCSGLWPEDNDPIEEPFSRAEMNDYVDFLYGQVDSFLSRLDLDSRESGFSWYPSFPKLDHQILTVRHLQGHVGQLSEILMQHGIDTGWNSRGNRDR